MDEWRPLDYIRFQNWGLAILKNCLLLFLFFSYGMADMYGCLYNIDVEDRCFWPYTILFADNIPYWWGTYIAAISLLICILTSDWA